MQNKKENIFYGIGYRDAIAGVLAECKDKVRLPEIAKMYEESFEKHFSHEWHMDDE